MPFVTLTKKAGTRAGVRGSFNISKHGGGLFIVSVPSANAGKVWDSFERCDYGVGDGDDKGLLLITGTQEGSFKVGRMRSSLVFRVRGQPEWVSGELPMAPLQVEPSEPGTFLLRLPAALFQPLTYAQAKKAEPTPMPAPKARVQGQRPPLSIVGTTVELADKRKRLDPISFKVFSLLWKAWGEWVRLTALEVATDGMVDVVKIMRSLNQDIAPLGLAVERRDDALQLMLKD